MLKLKPLTMSGFFVKIYTELYAEPKKPDYRVAIKSRLERWSRTAYINI